MPIATSHPVLKAVYEAASRLIERRSIPTELISASRTFYRSFDQDYLRVTANGTFPRQYADQALIIRDQGKDENRFSGQSFSGAIPAFGGLYCSLQQQAQINELMHYARTAVVNPNMVARYGAPPMRLPRNGQDGFPDVGAMLNRKCIVRIRSTSLILAADLSRHNSGTLPFLDEIGRSPAVQFALGGAGQRAMWDHLCDGTDCSVARGIGLAVANSSYLQALQVTTVRPSERSEDEAGDNLVFFGANGLAPGLEVDVAYAFPIQGPPVVYPVEG